MIELILGFVIFILILVLYSLIRTNSMLRAKIREISSSKQSLATRYGKMSEQFMPFMKDYPYDSENFRFLGTPIDGVQFEDDRVVFVEFKTSNSKLSEKQRKIRDIIRKKRVEWDEVRI